jgi:hypothetical protein
LHETHSGDSTVVEGLHVTLGRVEYRYVNYFDRLHAMKGHLDMLGSSLRIARVQVQTRPLQGSEFSAGTKPELQIWSGGKAVFTSSWQHVRHFEADEGYFTFDVDQVVSDDIVCVLPCLFVSLCLSVLTLAVRRWLSSGCLPCRFVRGSVVTRRSTCVRMLSMSDSPHRARHTSHRPIST